MKRDKGSIKKIKNILNIDNNLLKGIVIIILIFLFSCNNDVKKQDIDTKIKTKVERISKNKDTIIENNQTKSDCVRGVAVPIVKKSIFPKTKFQLQADKLTAIETIDLDNGDKVIIRNWGCESYNLTFRFETSRFKEKEKFKGLWIKNTVSLLNEIEKGIDSPIDIEKGIHHLINYIDNDGDHSYLNLKFGDEIDFGNNDMPQFLTVDKLKKLSDKRYAIEVTFSMGPL